MSSVDLHEFKKLYCQTAQDYLTGMQEDVTVLLTNLENKEKIESLFIKVHSLKSQSLVMGYESMGLLAKTIEQKLREIKEETRANSEAFMKIVAEEITHMNDSLASIIQTGEEKDLHAEIQKVEAI